MFSLLFSLAAVTCHPYGISAPHLPAGHEFILPQDVSLPLDSRDKLPVLIGPATAEDILKHRQQFRDAYEKVQITPDLVERWRAIEVPCTLVVAFGSWCGDSYHWVPDLIRLSEMPNPYISIHWIGTDRSKTTKKGDWPNQSIRQKVKRVPTFWLFIPAPGGKTKLVGKIVENPPKAGQTMADALLELLESAL